MSRLSDVGSVELRILLPTQSVILSKTLRCPILSSSIAKGGINPNSAHPTSVILSEVEGSTVVPPTLLNQLIYPYPHHAD